MTITTAVIPAAGMGMRLRSAYESTPKGLVRIHGETLIERSLRLLRRFDIERVILVTGYLASEYQNMARSWPEVELVHNSEYEMTGTMASLDRALAVAENEDLIVLESDIFFEARAIEHVLASDAKNLLLCSGTTAAGDEVWVQAPNGRLENISKDRTALTSVAGEYVGICRLSSALCQDIRRIFGDFVTVHGHGHMNYDMDAIVQASAQHPVSIHVDPVLLWGEIDDPVQLDRVRNEIAPRIAQLDRASASG